MTDDPQSTREMDTHQKRKYSRNGCTECKKRRMKVSLFRSLDMELKANLFAQCDETKPVCWTCQRLSRECVYILNRKNKKRRKKGEKPDESAGIDNDDNDDDNAKVKRISSPSTGSGNRSAARMLSIDNLITSPISLSGLEFSFNDANLIFNDLNDIVNSRLEEANYSKNYIEENFQDFYSFKKQSLLNLNKTSEIVESNVQLNSFNLIEPHKKYLEIYYTTFSIILLPLMPNIGLNPVRDVLLSYAKKELYLLYAILACGAKFSHKKTNSKQDNEAYYSYLSLCLKILSENFADDEIISEKIEPMLLTILLLTSDCASSKNLRWRSHLNGAKELFKKSMKRNSNSNSDIINFCQNWLISYEVLAGLTNFYGGIFQDNDNELDDFINNDINYLNSLKNLKMLDIHGFNYLSGHLIELDLVCKDVIKILNRKRKTVPKEGSYLHCEITPPIVDNEEIDQITIKLHELENKSIIDKSGIISNMNPNHPKNSLNLLKNFNNIETIKFLNNEEVTYSWFDISHQSHLIGCKLVFLTKVLEYPKTSIIIQNLVSKGLKFIEFLSKISIIELKNYLNFSFCHLHFPISVIGELCLKKEQQELVELYLNKIFTMGLDSANYNLMRLKKIWNNEKIEVEDILTW